MFFGMDFVGSCLHPLQLLLQKLELEQIVIRLQMQRCVGIESDIWSAHEYTIEASRM
jgi:hypothetical protein